MNEEDIKKLEQIKNNGKFYAIKYILTMTGTGCRASIEVQNFSKIYISDTSHRLFSLDRVFIREEEAEKYKKEVFKLIKNLDSEQLAKLIDVL